MTKKYRELPKLSFSETRDLLLDKIEPLILQQMRFPIL